MCKHKLSQKENMSIQTRGSLTASNLLDVPPLNLNMWIWGNIGFLWRSSPALTGWTGQSVDRLFQVCPLVFNWLQVRLHAVPLYLHALLCAPGCVEDHIGKHWNPCNF